MAPIPQDLGRKEAKSARAPNSESQKIDFEAILVTDLCEVVQEDVGILERVGQMNRSSILGVNRIGMVNSTALIGTVIQSRCSRSHGKPVLTEAITPEPQGDVSLEEMKEGLGDEMFLLDGIPAILFDSIYPFSMLEEYTHRLIEMFAPRLILGISDEISSTGDIERVFDVARIVDEYNKAVDST